MLPKDHEGHSVGAVLGELGQSAKDLIQSEVALARTEIKVSASKLGRHSAQAALFGACLSLSAFPFLAFLVIGLGSLLENNYWLSSLIIAVICAVAGGSMTYKMYRKMQQDDLSLPRSRENLHQALETVGEKAHEMKEASSEKVKNIRDRDNRSAS
ncbi:MAG: phage holin family protein [Bdellovibrionia bacterium]